MFHVPPADLQVRQVTLALCIITRYTNKLRLLRRLVWECSQDRTEGAKPLKCNLSPQMPLESHMVARKKAIYNTDLLPHMEMTIYLKYMRQIRQ